MFNKLASIAALGLVAALTACTQKATVEGTSSTSSGGSSSTTDVHRLVTSGGTLGFNGTTGFQNDVAVNPSTGLPAVAYVDRFLNGSGTSATGALKYAYMDTSGAWNIEVVDLNYSTAGTTCGSANSFCVGAPNGVVPTGEIVKLRFKSDGTPAIAYVYGASLNTTGTKQVRFAERSSSGVWSVNVGYSTTGATTTIGVDPIKALDFGLDSSNRPHITFTVYGTVVSASSQAYVFRSTGGSWTSSVVSSAVVPRPGPTYTTQANAVNSSGLFLCTNSGTDYPQIAMALASGTNLAQIRPVYAQCTTVNSAGACTAFSTVDLYNDCTGSCLNGTAPYNFPSASSNVAWLKLINSGVSNRPLLGFVVKTPNSVSSAYALAFGPNACTSAQNSAWTVTGVSTSANKPGLYGAALTATSTDYYAAFTQGTAALRINIGTVSTTPAFTALGHYVVSAADVTSTNNFGLGLAAYGSARASSHFYLSFASAASSSATANTIGGDVVVGHGPASDITNDGANGTFSTDIVDQTANGIFPNSVSYTGRFMDAATAPNGTVGFAYVGQDDATVTNTKLYYGIRGGPATGPSFAANNIANYDTPRLNNFNLSLAYDANSNPIVAYHGTYSPTTGTALYVARSSNGGANFSVVAVDKYTTTTPLVGAYPAVATTGNVTGVAYQDVTNTALKFARWSSTTGWRKFVVDGTTGGCNSSASSGTYNAITFDSTGAPIIAYQSDNALKVARGSSSDGITFTWTCLDLDAGANTRGAGIWVAVDSSDKVSVVHFDATSGTVRHVYSANAASTAFSTGASDFTAEVVGSTGTTSTTTPTISPRIRINSSGTKYVTYYTTSGLTLASKTSSGTSWSTETIGSASTGSYTTLQGSFGALTLNSGGYPTIFYRGNDNWIRYFSRESN